MFLQIKDNITLAEINLEKVQENLYKLLQAANKPEEKRDPDELAGYKALMLLQMKEVREKLEGIESLISKL